MKIIETSKRCAYCGNIIYRGIMIRTTYITAKRSYYCNKKCVGFHFDLFMRDGLLEFVEIKYFN